MVNYKFVIADDKRKCTRGQRGKLLVQTLGYVNSAEEGLVPNTAGVRFLYYIYH